MKNIIYIAGVLSLVGACASTDPGSGASVQYSLPKTNVAASLTMIIEACPNAAGKGLELDSKLSLAATSGAESQFYQIDGKDLASVRSKRNITINVDDKGVISGVNSSIEDRTAAIISNTVSIATKLIGLAAPPAGITSNDPGGRLQCRSEIDTALTRVKDLKTQIATKRGQMASSTDPIRRSELREDIDALAFEVARLRTGPLTQTLTTSVSAGTTAPAARQDVNFNYDGLREKWFVEPVFQAPAPGPGLPAPPPTPQPLTDDEMRFVFGVSWMASEITAAPGLTPPTSKTLGTCKLAMYVPAQTRATFDLSPYGAGVKSTKKAEVSTPIAQWGNPDQLCLSARFAENRTVNVSFTPFGQRKSFTWTSAARAEAVTSALSGLVDNVDSLNTSLESPSATEQRQVTIDRVDQLLEFNAARLCEEAAEAGATSCPDPDDD